jgi:uncharacterized SAM-binding protein YcdF (DUF218 family)
MTAGSDFVGYVLSAGGIVVCFLAVAIWITRSPSSQRARRFLLIAAVGFFASSIYGAEYLVSRLIVGSLKPFKASQAAPGRRTAIVVLGSGSVNVEDWDERTFSFTDRTAAARVLEAVRVFSLVHPAIVISSGGNPHPRRHSVPTGDTMRDALIALGVPRDRILVETVSKTTRDEVVAVVPLLATHGVDQTILVTSETHMPRALGAFRAAGIQAIPAVAQEFERDPPLTRVLLPSNQGLWVATSNAHEILGLIYYWLRGWWRA